jgi:hypothetical protein
MKTRRLLMLASAAAILLTAGGAAVAETLVVDDQVQLRDSTVDRPHRGATMASVEKVYGAPAQKHATIGQPPITRWDYPHFSVFFEKDRVIHAVATGS